MRLVVNGRDLRERAREFERPFARELAGAYGLPPAAAVLVPGTHLLGAPDVMFEGDAGRTILLACECGEPGCWPLEARIAVGDTVVTWSDFAQPHRPEWDYAAFGPFRFERSGYEAGIAAAAARFGESDV